MGQECALRPVLVWVGPCVSGEMNPFSTRRSRERDGENLYQGIYSEFHSL